MVTAYWIVASVLAAIYLYGGALKILRSQERLQPMMGWAGTDVPMPAVRAIGVVELLGAVGLVLPPLAGVAVELAMWAAIGFVLLQVLAFIVHARRGEARDSSMNVVLAVVAGVAAWLATSL